MCNTTPNTNNQIDDKLSVSFDCSSRKSTVSVATFNLIATVVGGGVLSLPLAFEKCGIVLATLLMIFAACITDRSLYLLCLTSRKTGASSYAELGKDALGVWMDWFISGLLFVFLVFVLTAFMVLIKDIWTPLIRQLVSLWNNNDNNNTADYNSIDESTVLLVLVLLMIPFLIERTLHTLRFNCYIGFGAVSLLCYALLHHGIIEITTTFPENIKLYPDNAGDVLFSFPIIVLSFLSTFNVLPVQNSLIRPTRKRIRLVIRMAVLVCFVLQYLFGLGGYLFAQSSTKGNILLNCIDNDSWMFLVGRLGCGITLLLALAMMMLPCRENLLQLIAIITTTTPSQQQPKQQPDEEEEIKIVGEETSLLPSSSNKDNTIQTSCWWYYGTTLGIGTVSFVGAVMAPGVAFVWNFCGSSMAFLIAFILPASCYLSIIRRNNHPTKEEKSWIYFSCFLIVFSVAGATACTWRTIVVNYDIYLETTNSRERL